MSNWILRLKTPRPAIRMQRLPFATGYSGKYTNQYFAPLEVSVEDSRLILRLPPRKDSQRSRRCCSRSHQTLPILVCCRQQKGDLSRVNQPSFRLYCDVNRRTYSFAKISELQRTGGKFIFRLRACVRLLIKSFWEWGDIPLDQKHNCSSGLQA